MIIPESRRIKLWELQEKEGHLATDTTPEKISLGDYHRGYYHGLRKAIDILDIDINEPGSIKDRKLRLLLPLFIFLLGFVFGKVIP